MYAARRILQCQNGINEKSCIFVAALVLLTRPWNFDAKAQRRKDTRGKSRLPSAGFLLCAPVIPTAKMPNDAEIVKALSWGRGFG